jgi:aminoglycoside phosphotransferase (APT) family kinase protein
MSVPVIDTELVRALIAEQFPQWSDLPVEFVPQGWDHRTFRLGDALSVRLPSAVGYVPQGEKERRWLPVLAAQLPLPIPAPVAFGTPSGLFPYPWSVFGWLEGDLLAVNSVVLDRSCAVDLARFLIALRAVDPAEGPPPGPHSAWRGSSPSVWEADVRRCLPVLDQDRRDRASQAWNDACAADSEDAPVWFHGDVAAGNLLLRDGHLAAVLDFGCSGVGDPSCDIAAAWMLFDGDARADFLAVLAPDERLLSRARGWALWKGLLRMEARGAESEWGERIVDAVLD